MGLTQEIRLLLVKCNNMSVSELARQMKTTPQNLGVKLRRDNLTESEMRKIADVLGYTVDIKFIKKK